MTAVPALQAASTNHGGSGGLDRHRRRPNTIPAAQLRAHHPAEYLVADPIIDSGHPDVSALALDRRETFGSALNVNYLVQVSSPSENGALRSRWRRAVRVRKGPYRLPPLKRELLTVALVAIPAVVAWALSWGAAATVLTCYAVLVVCGIVAAKVIPTRADAPTVPRGLLALLGALTGVIIASIVDHQRVAPSAYGLAFLSILVLWIIGVRVYVLASPSTTQRSS